MLFNTSVIEVIQNRYSCRSYRGEFIENKIKEKLLNFISGLKNAPFGSMARFHILEVALPEKTRMPGTYGIIKGAKNFIVGAIERGDKYLEDFGYLFETIILSATEIGLGTCWMGASFKRNFFADKIKLTPKEILPAICPVGYIASKRSIVDYMMYLGSRPRNRKPWENLFFNKNFKTPLSKNEAGEYSIPLEMVRLAPSAVNNQPWRIVKEKNCFHFFLQRAMGYDRIFRSADLQRIDMGIAMRHFDLTSKELNLKGKWEIMDMDIGHFPQRTEYLISWIS